MPENDIKLNDVIEFIGVYTFDPDVAVHDSNDDDEFPYGLMEDISVHLPPSKVCASDTEGFASCAFIIYSHIFLFSSWPPINC